MPSPEGLHGLVAIAPLRCDCGREQREQGGVDGGWPSGGCLENRPAKSREARYAGTGNSSVAARWLTHD